MDPLGTQLLFEDAVVLLKKMIATPSFSKEEQKVSELIASFLKGKGVEIQKHQLNIWAMNKHFDESKPTLLLNSHFDTVKPNAGYTLDPFEPLVADGKLYGLGSNDAGASLVSLMACFLHFYERTDLPYNLILAATAEEEVSGKNGVECLLPKLPKIDCAIVGEPTLLNLAIAEKGLLVLDCTAHGRSGHAAREEGDNALYKAVRDINWLSGHKFEKVSEFLGPVKLSVTQINAGTQHNVVPDVCSFVADIRLNELYTHQEVIDLLSSNLESEIRPRSTRIRSSIISVDHPLVVAGKKLGKQVYGSPTTSDKALMPFPALKMGPGDSARSHTADEFVYLDEIKEGIETYIKLLGQLQGTAF